MFNKSQLEIIVEGYRDALFFSMYILDEDECEIDLRDFQLSPEAEEKIKTDCEKFTTENYDLICFIMANAEILMMDYDFHSIGCDFLYTRNGVGVGFWDRGFGQLGDKITAEINKHFKEFNIFINADQKIDLE